MTRWLNRRCNKLSQSKKGLPHLRPVWRPLTVHTDSGVPLVLVICLLQSFDNPNPSETGASASMDGPQPCLRGGVTLRARTPKSELRYPVLRTSQPRLRSYFASSSAFRTPAPSPYSVTSEPRTPFVLRTSHLPDPMTYMSQITLMVRTYMRLVAY